jgi:alkylation response protein AidB-like acyl-CoA dehydrogenase
MDFRLTPEQTGFAQSLGELMTAADSVAVARSWAAGDHDPGLALWRRLADQGITGLVVPEEDGGLGGTPVDLVVAFEVLGHHLAVGPWIEAAAFLASALQGELATAVADGQVVTVAAPPLVPWGLDADVAEQVYLVLPDGLRAVGPASGTPSAGRSVDSTRRLFQVPAADGPGAGPAEPGAADLDGAFDLATLACAAELLGCGERLLADSVAYVLQRRQFGRVIGSYQAVKHQLADVRIALDFARPLVHGAALEASKPSALRNRSVSAAKVAAGDAAYRASRVALQVHGAIGYTAELDLGLWVSRVRALVGAWGGTTWHRERIATSLAADRAPRSLGAC